MNLFGQNPIVGEQKAKQQLVIAYTEKIPENDWRTRFGRTTRQAVPNPVGVGYVVPRVGGAFAVFISSDGIRL